MKRNIAIALSLSLILLVAACATSPATGATRGVITQMDNGKIVVTDADSKVGTYAVGFATDVYWSNGFEANRSDLTTGQRVQVWGSNGSATKIVIEP